MFKIIAALMLLVYQIAFMHVENDKNQEIDRSLPAIPSQREWCPPECRLYWDADLGEWVCIEKSLSIEVPYQ